MVTSWPKRLPGPGMSAERIAERIAVLSGGQITITVHAAGEVVPALDVLDAVGNGVAELGHTAAFIGRASSRLRRFSPPCRWAHTFRTHGLDRRRRRAGIVDEMYAPFGVKPFMGGNTGT